MLSRLITLLSVLCFLALPVRSDAEEVQWKPAYQKLAQIVPESAANLDEVGRSAQADQKRERIEAEIAAAEKQKKNGLLMMAGGIGSMLAGYFLFVSELEYNSERNVFEDKGNEALYYTAIMGGGVAQIWGAYMWWDGAQTAKDLKVKYYDISLRPEIKWDSDGDRTVAVALKIGF